MSLIHSQKELSEFLREKVSLKGFTLATLKEEASRRDYYRVTLKEGKEKSAGGFIPASLSSFVISVNHEIIKKDDDFLTIQKEFKKQAMPVPEIQRVDHEQGLIWQA